MKNIERMNKRPSLAERRILVATGLGLAASLTLAGCSAEGEQAPAPTSNEQTQAAEPTPETDDSTEMTKTLALEVDQTPEQLGKDLATSLQSVGNYRIVESLAKFDEAFEAYWNDETTVEPDLQTSFEDNAKKARKQLETLFVEGHENNPNLVKFAQRYEDTNFVHAWAYRLTGEEGTPYEHLKMEENSHSATIENESETTAFLAVEGERVPVNPKQAAVTEQMDGKVFDTIGHGDNWHLEAELTKVDDTWLISDLEYTSSPREK